MKEVPGYSKNIKIEIINPGTEPFQKIELQEKLIERLGSLEALQSRIDKTGKEDTLEALETIAAEEDIETTGGIPGFISTIPGENTILLFGIKEQNIISKAESYSLKEGEQKTFKTSEEAANYLSGLAEKGAVHELGHITYDKLTSDEKAAWDSFVKSNKGLTDKIIEVQKDKYPSVDQIPIGTEAFAELYTNVYSEQKSRVGSFAEEEKLLKEQYAPDALKNDLNTYIDEKSKTTWVDTYAELVDASAVKEKVSGILEGKLSVEELNNLPDVKAKVEEIIKISGTAPSTTETAPIQQAAPEFVESKETIQTGALTEINKRVTELIKENKYDQAIKEYKDKISQIEKDGVKENIIKDARENLNSIKNARQNRLKESQLFLKAGEEAPVNQLDNELITAITNDIPKYTTILKKHLERGMTLIDKIEESMAENEEVMNWLANRFYGNTNQETKDKYFLELRSSWYVHDVGKLGPLDADENMKGLISNLYELPKGIPSESPVKEGVRRLKEELNLPDKTTNDLFSYLEKQGINPDDPMSEFFGKHHVWGEERITNQVSERTAKIVLKHGNLLYDPLITLIDAYDAKTSRYNAILVNGQEITIAPLSHDEAIKELKESLAEMSLKDPQRYKNVAIYEKIVDIMDKNFRGL